MKDDGGLVYPGKRRERLEHSDGSKAMGQETHFMGEVHYPGITRRNKLIDDLVVALTAGYVAADRGWNMKEAIKDAIQIADLTIAESNK